MNDVSNTLPAVTAPASDAPVASFAFGDPESVIDRRELPQYFEVWRTTHWYHPPFPMVRLAQVFNMSPHHRGAIAVKTNLLVSQQVPTRWLSKNDFERFVIDFLQMGNGYLERVPNMAGGIQRAAFTPARHTRRGIVPDVCWFVENGVEPDFRFAPGTVFQLQQPDVAQEIYGVPEWISGLQSGLLNESATLFRRRYYLNGAHAGFVFHLTDTLINQETVDQLVEKFKSAKGVGNFKNLFLYTPGGKKDGVQIHPIADVAAKDEFLNVKNLSRDDLLTAHRVPPHLMGIIPQNAGGFGNVTEALDTFMRLEIVPIMGRMLAMNEWFGAEVLRFDPYMMSNGDMLYPDGTITPAGSLRRG